MSMINNFLKNKLKVTVTSTPRHGFNFNYVMEEYSGVRKNRYNISTIQRDIEILKDCGNLINTTKNPDVFFQRYLIAIAILNDLILVERKLSFAGDKPSKIKKQFQTKEILTVNDFLDRYYQDILSKITKYKTAKAKENQINTFFKKIDEYSIYLTPESLKKYNDMCEQLKQQCLN